MAGPALLARPGTTAQAILAALPATAAVFAAPMRWPWRRVPLTTAAIVVLALSLAVDVVYRGPKSYAGLWAVAEFPALLVLTGRVVRRAPDRQAAVVGALAVAATVLLPLRFLFAEPSVAGSAVALTCAFAFFPAVGAAGTGLYLRTLENRRIRAVEKARRDQRLEVAGDLHDFVAHEVTGIVLEVQAARVAAYDREQLDELLERLEEAGLRALESMDRTVRTLRDPEGGGEEGQPPPTRVHGLADLAEMVERFAATGGGVRAGSAVRTVLELEEGLTGALPRETEDAVHRVVLEALTNIRRHAAGAGRVTVTVARVDEGAGDVGITGDVGIAAGVGTAAGVGGAIGPRDVGGAGGVRDAVAVTVVDDGGTSGGRSGGPLSGARQAGGTGLAALRARVEALGGRLEYGSYGTGWRVRAVLPAAGRRPLRR
ncbi:two-component sensor histidine kinase [Streptomyces sp. MST-110588]|nr:two-component sensor histidine kinase [Streptomyces sp. MST-110588]